VRVPVYKWMELRSSKARDCFGLGVVVIWKLGASLPAIGVRTENLTANVLMMQSAQNRNRHDIADRLPASEPWCVFAQR
jgi:hypothetical protein